MSVATKIIIVYKVKYFPIYLIKHVNTPEVAI